MTTERSILDDIFGKSDDELETFMEAISDQINPDAFEEHGADQSQISRIHSSAATGEAEKVEAPQLVEQVYGRIRMVHGWDIGDYVWHISTVSPKVQWKVTDYRLTYGVAKIMNETIPNDCEVKIWLPVPTWEISEYTFKALNLKHFWQISDQMVEDMNMKLLKVLETMI